MSSYVGHLLRHHGREGEEVNSALVVGVGLLDHGLGVTLDTYVLAVK